MMLGGLIERLEKIRDLYDAEGLHDDVIQVQVSNDGEPLDIEVVWDVVHNEELIVWICAMPEQP